VASVGTATKIRTNLVILLMRALGHERLYRLHRRGLLRPLEAILLRGQLSIHGGLGVRMRLDAASFPIWGAQALGVLLGWHEVQVQEALRRSLRPGDVVWDVGANLGAISLSAARVVGPGGMVVALEPEAGCAAAVRRNAQLNGIGWIDVREVAAAARTGEAEVIVVEDTLWSRLASVGEHELEVDRRLVPACALDDLDAPAPALVKIDVEGGELEVLAGMRRLLAEARPLVLCEMHGKNAAFAEVMEAAGYDVDNLDGPAPIPQAGGNDHALCVPR
jgi:FkbM family methyltransferase